MIGINRKIKFLILLHKVRKVFLQYELACVLPKRYAIGISCRNKGTQKVCLPCESTCGVANILDFCNSYCRLYKYEME